MCELLHIDWYMWLLSGCRSLLGFVRQHRFDFNEAISHLLTTPRVVLLVICQQHKLQVTFWVFMKKLGFYPLVFAWSYSVINFCFESGLTMSYVRIDDTEIFAVQAVINVSLAMDFELYDRNKPLSNDSCGIHCSKVCSNLQALRTGDNEA